MANNDNLKRLGSQSVADYKAKFNNSKLDIIPSQNKPGIVFFSCGVLPNGKPNYGAIGPKAWEILQSEGQAGVSKLEVVSYEVTTADGTKRLDILQAYGGNAIMSL